jgi:peptidyl-prolyl cis-trans isomerase D
MLRSMQKATANWLGRVITGLILGLIAISFAIWGIGDIFRGFGLSKLATVGNTEIGIEQFRQAYNDRLQQLARRLGRPLPADQARALGLDRQLLGQMLAEAALDEDARRLGLGLSDAEVAKRITADPTFRGATGQFDRTTFEQIIRQAGYTEGRYVAEQRRVSMRRQIADAITGALKTPAVAVELQHRFADEQRSIDYVEFGPAQAGDIAQPSDDVLAKYFEERKGLFRAPEYRTIDLVVLNPHDVARWTEVSDADARKYYDEHRANYGTPEKRAVEQIVFPKADDARAAATRIAGGESFEKIAQERGLKENDYNLGLVAKSDLLDPAVANAAFSLNANSVSEPIAGRFGSVLVRVGKIEPEKIRPFEEAAAEIKRDIALQRAKAQVVEQHDKIEDERGAGLPLRQLAEKLKVPVRRIEAIDRSGRDPQGNPVPDLPRGVDIVTPAFASDVSVENDPLQTADGGYVWYEVDAITPSRERKFEEVKDHVAERWREDQIATKLKEKAAALTDKLKGANFAETANAEGLKVQTATGFKRGQSKDGIPEKVVSDLFKTLKGNVGDVEGDRPTRRFVFRVSDVTVLALDPNSAEAKQTAEAMRNMTIEELLGQYIARLEADLGTTINEAAFNQATGAATQ